jgi:hypothetical protein
MNYYLIKCDANGISIQEFTKERLEKELQKGILDADGKPLDFLSLLADDSDRWQYRSLSDNGGNIVIKGDIVVPRAVQVTTRWEI